MRDRKSPLESCIDTQLTTRNYTIELSYVTPLDSLHPRSNLVARDRSMSNGPGSEVFPYSGQSFVRIPSLGIDQAERQDACTYTDCPIPANVTNQYTYEFVTLNDVSPLITLFTAMLICSDSTN